MKKAIFSLKITAILSASAHAQQTEDKIYHYSSMDALRNGVYSGYVAVKELKEKSDFGLGTYDFLDGELIQLDGHLFRVATDGSVETASEKRQVSFGSFTFFKKDQSITAERIKTVADLQKKLVQLLPSQNRFYAIKIEVGFENLILGGAVKVSEKDTTGIATFMKTRPKYKKQNIRGTLVGFYSPPYIGGLDLSPFHFHFISDDKTAGGHLIDSNFSDTKIIIQLDEKSIYEIVLPYSNNDGYQRNWKTSEAKSQY